MIKSGLRDKLKTISEAVSFNSKNENDIDSFHAQYEVTFLFDTLTNLQAQKSADIQEF